MRLKRLRLPRHVLLFSGAALVAGLLVAGHAAPTPPSDQGVVWVYYTSLCARPNDASACTVVHGPSRPSFDSHESCSAYRDLDLGREANPRLMGSCQKQREA
jgi:hypothetical protein